MFSTDMVVSMFVFIGVVYLSFTLLDASTDVDGFSEYEVMEDYLRTTSNILLGTEGYPNNWNYSNVKVPGISTGEGGLSAEKFNGLSYVNYDEFLRSNRIFGYGFYIEINGVDSVGGICNGGTAVLTDQVTETVKTVDSSNSSWDMYYYGEGNGFENLSSLNSVYNGSSQEMSEKFVSNLSRYDCAVSIGEAQIGDINTLEDFVEDNVFVQIRGGEYLTELNGINGFEQVPENFSVENSSVLNHEINQSENISLENSSNGFSNYDQGFLVGDGVCGVCSWDNSVYYLSSDTFEKGLRQSLSPDNGNVLTKTFYGSKPFYGERPSGEFDVVPMERSSLLFEKDETKPVTVKTVLWR